MNCALRIDKSVFNADKDVLLTASYEAPFHDYGSEKWHCHFRRNLLQEIREEK